MRHPSNASVHLPVGKGVLGVPLQNAPALRLARPRRASCGCRISPAPPADACVSRRSHHRPRHRVRKPLRHPRQARSDVLGIGRDRRPRARIGCGRSHRQCPVVRAGPRVSAMDTGQPGDHHGVGIRVAGTDEPAASDRRAGVRVDRGRAGHRPRSGVGPRCRRHGRDTGRVDGRRHPRRRGHRPTHPRRRVDQRRGLHGPAARSSRSPSGTPSRRSPTPASDRRS